jgi:hypothetical protein
MLFKQAHVSAGIDFKKYDDIEVLQFKLGSAERTKRQPIPSDGYGVQEQTIKTTDQ